MWAYWMRTVFLRITGGPAAGAAGRLRRARHPSPTDRPADCPGTQRDLAAAASCALFEQAWLSLSCSAPITTGGPSYWLRRQPRLPLLDRAARTKAVLAAAAEALGPATRAREVLTVIASSSSVWACSPPPPTAPRRLAAATAAHPAVRIAFGPISAGIDGFRRSHFTRRHPAADVPPAWTCGSPGSPISSATCSVIPGDEQRAREFVAQRSASSPARPRAARTTAAHAYIGEQFSAARAARALYNTHRNTVLTASSAPNGCSRSRWPTTASRSASPSTWGPVAGHPTRQRHP